MHEILRNLPDRACVLDLGSRNGSFGPECCPGAVIVRLDMESASLHWNGGFVQADAASLPFRGRTFEAVVANHSLEHMADLTSVLDEIGRVIRRGGRLYVAVPDASTLTDKLYRWVYHGGGHVNPFRSAGQLTLQISHATSLPLAATRALYSSFGFLERRNFHPRPPRRLWLLGNGNPRFIAVMSYAARLLDRWLRTRTSLYGWAFYFGDIPETIETTAWTNVCVNCGAGHSEAALTCNKLIRRVFMAVKAYNCPNCGSWNLFTKDRRKDHLENQFGF
jgi:ribosomal protein L40E